MSLSFRKSAWMVIAVLVVLFSAAGVRACTPVPALQPAGTGAVAGGLAGSQHIPYFITRESCTREAMDRCEYGCMMPGGILDLACYEDCIYSIC